METQTTQKENENDWKEREKKFRRDLAFASYQASNYGSSTMSMIQRLQFEADHYSDEKQEVDHQIKMVEDCCEHLAGLFDKLRVAINNYRNLHGGEQEDVLGAGIAGIVKKAGLVLVCNSCRSRTIHVMLDVKRYERYEEVGLECGNCGSTDLALKPCWKTGG